MGKNNLDGIHIKGTQVLPKPKNKVGRPTVDASEKESETITLKVTPSELEAVKEKAGVAPVSTFVKHHIRTNSDLFNK